MISIDRVVAIRSVFHAEVGLRPKMGSGYLLDDRTLLTAAHILKGPADQLAVRLHATRALDLDSVTVTLGGGELVVDDVGDDWAIVHLPRWVNRPISSPPPRFEPVDQTRSGNLEDCVVIGYPHYAADPIEGPVHREVHGRISVTDGADLGHLLLQSDLRPARPPNSLSAWSGLSGGVVFQGGRAIGVVTAHSVRDGAAAFRISGVPSPHTISDGRVRALLGMVSSTDEPTNVLRKLEVKLAGGYARVRDLTPYDLGASDWRTGSERDDYVPRHIDSILDADLRPGCFLLVRGGPKSGKTRTVYEALRRNCPDAVVLAMDPLSVGQVMTHPHIIALNQPAVLWLDDAEHFMRSENTLTRAFMRDLQNRSDLMVVGSIRSDQAGQIERIGPRSSFGLARVVPLEYASSNPAEHSACKSAYPWVDLRRYSLPEQLVGAPQFRVIYEESRQNDLALRAVLETAIDWVRTGVSRPIRRSLLLTASAEIDCSDAPWNRRRSGFDHSSHCKGMRPADVYGRRPHSWQDGRVANRRGRR